MRGIGDRRGWDRLRGSVDALLGRWHLLDKGSVVFFGLLILPVAALAFTAYSLAAERRYTRDLTCLTLNIYHEARGEPLRGQRAVAEVTLNRVASPRYPDTVCEVVFQKNWDSIRQRHVGAFSWTEFDRHEQPEARAWRRAWEAAEAVYSGTAPPAVAGALHYHARSIRPSWARQRAPLARIGRHLFYD